MAIQNVWYKLQILSPSFYCCFRKTYHGQRTYKEVGLYDIEPLEFVKIPFLQNYFFLLLIRSGCVFSNWFYWSRWELTLVFQSGNLNLYSIIGDSNVAFHFIFSSVYPIKIHVRWSNSIHYAFEPLMDIVYLFICLCLFWMVSLAMPSS